MALKKSFETPEGANGEYWRIVEYRKMDGQEFVKVGLYASQQARLDGKRPIFVKTWCFEEEVYDEYGELKDPNFPPSPFSLTEMDKAGKNYLSVGYDFLKTLDLFSGSVDV